MRTYVRFRTRAGNRLVASREPAGFRACLSRSPASAECTYVHRYTPPNRKTHTVANLFPIIPFHSILADFDLADPSKLGERYATLRNSPASCLNFVNIVLCWTLSLHDIVLRSIGCSRMTVKNLN